MKSQENMNKGKVGKGKMKWCLYAVLLVFVLYFSIQAYAALMGLKMARNKLNTYNRKVADLSYGTMTYVDEGEGEVILSVHGYFWRI